MSVMTARSHGLHLSDEQRGRALAPVLIFTTMVTAIISSLGAPLIPSVSNDLHVSLSAAQWSLTATLLVGAVSAPIMGRLGDGRHRRETLIGGLGLVTLGGVISALAPDLALLVAGRALQGIGLGLIPLTMAAARDHLPKERVAPTIALLSVCAAAGVGAGYPISGLIADSAGLSAAYWFGAAVSALALACVLLVVPSSPDRPDASLDVTGAVLLAGGLVALLLAIAEGEEWGWTSFAVIGLLVAAAIVLGAWVAQQLRTTHPLVELRLMRHPAVLTGNAAATVLGVAMYTYLSCVTEFVQTPKPRATASRHRSSRPGSAWCRSRSTSLAREPRAAGAQPPVRPARGVAARLPRRGRLGRLLRRSSTAPSGRRS